MATLVLAGWAVALTTDIIPNSAQHAALRSLYNYIGCTIGGSNHPTVQKATQALSRLSGPPTSSILGHKGSLKLDAQYAALLNGIASHVHDYDDTHLDTIIHPTGVVASALLAYIPLLDRPVSGEELLTALVCGIEASCKLGLAVWPSHYDIGWHITSTTGSIGAAVTVGKLMRLDETQMAHCIGLAATQVTGLREMFGSDTKSFHVGRAAQNGLLAAVLAECGYTSSLEALEAKRGWGNVVIGKEGKEPQWERWLGSGEEGLGKRWEVERNAFKPFPCGIVCHPAIDACVQLHGDMGEKGLKTTDIVKVEESVHHLVIELTSKRKPKDGLEGKFSVYHGSAVGLLFGKAGPAEYADDVVTSAAVIELRDKIDAMADDKVQPDEVFVTVHMKDGRQLEKHIEHAIGSLEVPMTDAQLSEKFIDQAGLVLGENDAKMLSDLVWIIGQSDDVDRTVRIL